MPSDHHHVRACPRQNAHDIHHRDLANWRGCGERVTLQFDASRSKLCRNVLSGSLKRGGPRRTRTQYDELLQVLKGSRSVETLRRPSEVGPGSVVSYHERNHYHHGGRHGHRLSHSMLLLNTAATES